MEAPAEGFVGQKVKGSAAGVGEGDYCGGREVLNDKGGKVLGEVAKKGPKKTPNGDR